jgi:hypothetical protein
VRNAGANRLEPEPAREGALGVLEALPQSPSMLEQAFDVRLELRPVLNQLGEVPRDLGGAARCASLDG